MSVRAALPGPPTTSLGDWIRQARTSQGISQRGLADRSGLSRSYLCDLERGRGAKPSVTTLDKLAIALGAPRPDLLRAAGVLEPSPNRGDQAAERRLLALYRALSSDGRAAIERFARFTHAEEHRWVQPPLLSLNGSAPSLESIPEPATAPHHGPTLFDGMSSDPEA